MHLRRGARATLLKASSNVSDCDMFSALGITTNLTAYDRNSRYGADIDMEGSVPRGALLQSVLIHMP